MEDELIDNMIVEDERSIPGGFSKMFNRAVGSGALSRCSQSGQALYPFLVWLADQAHQFTISDASHVYLQKITGMSQNTIRGGLQSLRDNHLLHVIREARRPTATHPLGQAAAYQLLVPPVRPLDPEDELGQILKERRVKIQRDLRSESEPTTPENPTPRWVNRRAEVGSGSAGKKRSVTRNSSKKDAAAVIEQTRQGHVQSLGEGARLLIDAGIDEDIAVALASLRSVFEIRAYIERSQDMDSPTGWLVTAIRKGYQLHKGTVEKLKRREQEAVDRERRLEANRRTTRLREMYEQETKERYGI